MSIKIALAGNPNCGKTTMFNNLTGSNQYVGNWPGVTVEKKEGKLKGANDVIIQDLPGIYSLSPYTLEEVVARGYLVNEQPDVILNIVDASNLERNLYLTTQLIELGIPVVIALNMIDVVRKKGDTINIKKLGEALGCEVMETSALKGEGSAEIAKKAAALAGNGQRVSSLRFFDDTVEHAITHIEDVLKRQGHAALQNHNAMDGEGLRTVENAHLTRWYAIKLFERDEKVLSELQLSPAAAELIEAAIQACEKEMDDDAEAIITNQRYAYIQKLMAECLKKSKSQPELTPSDKLDRIVTNRWAALPIFAMIMFLVYYISVTTVGSIVTDFTNDTLIAGWIQKPVMNWLTTIGCADWLTSLIVDGIIGGAGAVIGFVPQMLVLFFMLAILEDVGYMSRVAFIMDRVFRKFGLSGKSFIPMLISSGCGVPGIMASRTIENDRDRKMTIITATFIPCSAKMPMIGLLAGALFNNAGWMAFAAYFIGVGAVIASGILLKKTRPFAGNPAPFVMELPSYHAPAWKNVLHSVWERGSSFIKRAGTVIVVASILIWFTSSYGWTTAQPEITTEHGVVAAETIEDARTTFGAVEDMDESMLGKIGAIAAPVFEPLGFGSWQSTVATVMGLVAKEEVVGVLGVLYGMDDGTEVIANNNAMHPDEKIEPLSPIQRAFNESSHGHAQLAAFCFLIFNLLCAPCFAAMGAIKREMNNGKWTAFAIAYQCGFAYIITLIVFQLGLLFSGEGFTMATAVASVLLAGMTYLLLRKNPYKDNHLIITDKAGI